VVPLQLPCEASTPPPPLYRSPYAPPYRTTKARCEWLYKLLHEAVTRSCYTKLLHEAVTRSCYTKLLHEAVTREGQSSWTSRRGGFCFLRCRSSAAGQQGAGGAGAASEPQGWRMAMMGLIKVPPPNVLSGHAAFLTPY